MQNNNKKALVVAYYLSRFDREGLENLGYESFREAYRIIGQILSVNPNSIKNMRDEFDPIHDNARKGWYQRELRPSRVDVVKAFQEKEEEDIREFILELINSSETAVSFFDTISNLSEKGKK